MPFLNLVGGWAGMLAGVLSGAMVGLFFHREDWMGGYGSHRRRLTRLGHISFFGLGFLNLLFALSAPPLNLPGRSLQVASVSLMAAAITMPICCFLTAWKSPFRHLFPIPVISAAVGIVSVLLGWRRA